MKIKTLLLSTVAAAGLSSAALAADPAALTSLDVCDALGISGLTISSDSNCLQISGRVGYMFRWGDNNLVDGNWPAVAPYIFNSVGGSYDAVWFPDDGGVAGADHDWRSQVDVWLQFVGSAESDYGTASATIRVDSRERFTVTNENGPVASVGNAGDVAGVLNLNRAFVSVGDTTVLSAGLKPTIANFGNDTPYNWTGLYNSNRLADAIVERGVFWNGATGIRTGGYGISVESDLGNGVNVGVALERLGSSTTSAGSLVGVLEYAGDTLAAHITIVGDDVLLGAISNWGVHAGATLNIDMFEATVAIAADSSGWWNALGSVQATFDMFTLAASVEGTSGGPTDELGFGASASADVTDTVAITLGGRWFDYDTATANTEQWHVALRVVADVTESITLTGIVGVDGETATSDTVAFGEVSAAWAPGGGFTTSVTARANANSAYRLQFNAAKSF